MASAAGESAVPGSPGFAQNNHFLGFWFVFACLVFCFLVFQVWPDLKYFKIF